MKHNFEQTLIEIEDILEDYKSTSGILTKDSVNCPCIHINLENENIYQDFSNRQLLKEEIFDYIDKSFHYTKKNTTCKLCIHFPREMQQEEKQNILRLIQIHYALKFKEASKEIRRTNIKGTISVFLGASLFFIFGLLEWYNVNFIFRGIIEIFSWVFIWEACDSYAFTNSKNRIDRFTYYMLYKASRTL